MSDAHVARDGEAHDGSTAGGRFDRPVMTGVVRGAFLAFMLAGALFLAACGGGDDSLGTIHGLITDVQARTITEIESLSVRDDAGKTWVFTTEGPLEAFPSHLTEHMLNAQQVRVVFEEQAAGLVAVSILDFP